MKENLVIFGIGKIAEAVSYFFERDSKYEICAYVCDVEYATTDVFLGKPVIPFSKLSENYASTSYMAFVAVGYQLMNKLRADKVEALRNLGYSFASYVSPDVKGNFTVGDNTIIMDGVVIQPCVSFGNNVFVWGGTMIGHHAVIEDNCWLTGGCLIGGITKIKENSFIGIGAIVGHEIIIGEKCMIGAGTLSCKNVLPGKVLISPNTEEHRLNSDQFTRMSSCFRV